MDRQRGSRDYFQNRSEVDVDVESSATRTSDSHLHLVHTSNANAVNHSADNKKGRWETLLLAYRTLGVVFGGLVTSPLYVYPSMHLKSPTEDDYLGIFSIMFWTLTLIGVVKYASIALNADDQGEASASYLVSEPNLLAFMACSNLAGNHSFDDDKRMRALVVDSAIADVQPYQA